MTEKKSIKIGWGTGIFITIVLFVAGMGFLVVLSSRQKFSMVEEAYYPKGIEYQKQINKLVLTKGLKEQPYAEQKNDSITVHFPKDFTGISVQGTVHFYRPSDDTGDQTYDIKLNDSLSQTFTTDNLLIGRYIIKLEWQATGKDYYAEIPILIDKN
jgi:hypothetical protein